MTPNPVRWPRAVYLLFKESVVQWREDRVARVAAALSFYALLSVAPLIAVITALAGFVLGQQAAEGELVHRLQILIGPQAAEVVQGVVATTPIASVRATILGVGILVFAASNLFSQLQRALNAAWRIEDRARGGVRGSVEARLVALLLLLFTGALLAVSVVASTVTAVLIGALARNAPAAIQMPSGDELLTFIFFTALIAVIFKWLPDTHVSWRDVWIGAAFTALLLMLGMQVTSRYLASRGLASVYGASAAIVYVLLWVYYSVQVFLFGAVVTHVFAVRYGSRRHELEALMARRAPRGEAG